MYVSVMDEGNFLAAIGNAYIPSTSGTSSSSCLTSSGIHIAIIVGDIEYVQGLIFNNTTIFSHQPVFMFLLHNADNVSPLK